MLQSILYWMEASAILSLFKRRPAFNPRKSGDIMYADDPVLGKSEEELDRVVGCINDACKRRVLQVYASKTRVSERDGRSECNSLHSEGLEDVNEF